MTIGNFFQDAGLGLRGANEAINQNNAQEDAQRNLELLADQAWQRQREKGATRAMEQDYLNTWGDVGRIPGLQPGQPTQFQVPPDLGGANGEWDRVPGLQPYVTPEAPPTSFRDPNDYGSNDLARLRARGEVAQRMTGERRGEINRPNFQAWMDATGGRLAPGQNQRQAYEAWRQQGSTPAPRSIENLIQQEAATAEQPQAPAPAPAQPQGAAVQTAPEIQAAAQKYGIPTHIMHNLWMTESGGGKNQLGPPIVSSNPKLNGQRAKGHFQFIDETAQRYGVQVGDLPSEADGAARYLRDLYQQTGSWEAAIAAYGGHSASSPTRASYVGGVLGGGAAPTAQAATQPSTSQPTAGLSTSTVQPSPAGGVMPVSATSIQIRPGQQFTASTSLSNEQEDMTRRMAASALRMGQLRAFIGDWQGSMGLQQQGATMLLSLLGQRNQQAANAAQMGDFGPALSLMEMNMPGVKYSIKTMPNNQVELYANGQLAKTMSSDDFYTAFRRMTDQQFNAAMSQYQIKQQETMLKHAQTIEVEKIKSMSAMLVEALKGNVEIAKHLARYGVSATPLGGGSENIIVKTPNGVYVARPEPIKIPGMPDQIQYRASPVDMPSQ